MSASPCLDFAGQAKVGIVRACLSTAAQAAHLLLVRPAAFGCLLLLRNFLVTPLMLAYLVIREGTKWTDVYRLVPGRTVTVGRAGTNQIVIKDERASRTHAEIFVTRGAWTLRDLDSRNGTFVGERQIRGDYSLQPGDVVRIAGCYLAFVQDLTQAFPDPVTGSPGAAQLPLGDETVSAAVAADTGELSDSADVLDDTHHMTTITHRRNQTRFLVPGGQ